MLKIFNTLTRKKEKFQPINSGKVGIYVCGVTVYDFCHIGHARTFIFFDFVVKYLRYSGYSVNYVRNITDIDDKIIQRSAQNKESYQQLTDRMIVAMHDDFKILNMAPPDHEPRVTQHINNIIEMISGLLDKNCAYIAPNGDILFSIEHKKNYNILSRQNPKKLYIMDTSNTHTKRHPMDFVLWKKCDVFFSKKNKIAWMSPWGLGRPGWHIECSAVSNALLGKHFDIHGGGSDLIFPHHENEIAQTTSLYNTHYVNFWMHVGMVTCDFEKMSKSINNVITIREILRIYDPETIRYFLLSTHYRSVINYTDENLRQSRVSLEHLYLSLKDIDTTCILTGGEYFIEKFIDEINNDFNTPGAYSVLFEIAHVINRFKKQPSKHIAEIQSMGATLRYLGGLLGFLNQNPEFFLKKKHNLYALHNKNIVHEIELLIKNRNVARKEHKWILADQIRSKLSSLGVKLSDSSDRTDWWFVR